MNVEEQVLKRSIDQKSMFISELILNQEVEELGYPNADGLELLTLQYHLLQGHVLDHL